MHAHKSHYWITFMVYGVQNIHLMMDLLIIPGIDSFFFSNVYFPWALNHNGSFHSKQILTIGSISTKFVNNGWTKVIEKYSLPSGYRFHFGSLIKFFRTIIMTAICLFPLFMIPTRRLFIVSRNCSNLAVSYLSESIIKIENKFSMVSFVLFCFR